MKKNFINIVSFTSLALAGIISGLFSFITTNFLNKFFNNDKN
jgi:hypothetical protein